MADFADKDRLITRWRPWALGIAHSIAISNGACVDIDDLKAAAMVGLTDAANRYEPQRGRFKTYAQFRIRGEVLSEIRSTDWLSRSTRKKVWHFRQAVDMLQSELEREPSELEIAEKMDVSLEWVQKTRRLSYWSVNSYEELEDLGECGKETDTDALIDKSSDALARLCDAEQRKRLGQAIASLPEKERQVIWLYHMDEVTMKEVGKILGVTESRVSQIHKLAIERLKKKLRGK